MGLGSSLSHQVNGNATRLFNCRQNEQELEFVVIMTQSGGRKKGYRRFVPPLTNSTLRPLLLVFPGHSITGEKMRVITNYGFERDYRTTTLIERPVVIYMDVKESIPNELITDEIRSIDEFTFVRLSVENEIKTNIIYRKLVFATGFGSGGHFIFQLPVKCCDLICAIAPVSALMSKGSITYKWPVACPVCLIVGDNDNFVSLDGLLPNSTKRTFSSPRHKVFEEEAATRSIDSSPKLTRHQKQTFFSSVGLSDTIHFISNQNELVPPIYKNIFKMDIYDNCNDGTIIELYEANFVFSSGKAIRTFSKGCPGLQVFKVKGGGHQWPMGQKQYPKSLYGKLTKNLNACEAIWNFFAHVAESIRNA